MKASYSAKVQTLARTMPPKASVGFTERTPKGDSCQRQLFSPASGRSRPVGDHWQQPSRELIPAVARLPPDRLGGDQNLDGTSIPRHCLFHIAPDAWLRAIGTWQAFGPSLFRRLLRA